MYVITADQQASRTSADRVGALLDDLSGWARTVRPFERTAGDEVQGLLDQAEAVADVVRHLLRDGGWAVGVGIGAVRQPLPDSTRAGAGEAFNLARDAVTRAKSRTTRLAVTGTHDAAATRAQTGLDLIALLYRRRSREGWAAVDLAAEGLTGVEVADRLGISKQAASQRLAAAEWTVELPGRQLVTYLLAQADTAS
jgi:hypothetical protein